MPGHMEAMERASKGDPTPERHLDALERVSRGGTPAQQEKKKSPEALRKEAQQVLDMQAMQVKLTRDDKLEAIVAALNAGYAEYQRVARANGLE